MSATTTVALPPRESTHTADESVHTKEPRQRITTSYHLFCAGTQLGVIDTTSSKLTALDTGYSSYGRLAVTGPGLSDAEGDITLVTVGGSASKAGAVVMLQVGSRGGVSYL
jgi:hypothetical protein